MNAITISVINKEIVKNPIKFGDINPLSAQNPLIKAKTTPLPNVAYTLERCCCVRLFLFINL